MAAVSITLTSSNRESGVTQTWEHPETGATFYVEITAKATSQSNYTWHVDMYSTSAIYFNYTFGVNTSVSDYPSEAGNTAWRNYSGFVVYGYGGTSSTNRAYLHDSTTSGSSQQHITADRTWSGGSLTIYGHCLAGNDCKGGSGSDNGHYAICTITDNITWYTAPTCSGNASVTAISGTTVTVSVPSWTNGTDSATATIVCSDYSSGTTIDTKTITSSSGGTVTFTGLENGVRYRFRVTISDGTTSLSITASDGNSPNARTYACAVTDIDTSTCRIQFTAKPTAGSIQGSYVYESATITYTITGSTTATGTTSAGGSTLTINGFTHNTTHTISIYITGVTDTNGNYDATDSDSDSAVTKTLSLTGEIGECTMTTIETSWQALVDGSAQDADNLSGDYYTFCTSSTSSHNHYPACETTNGSGYIKSETTPTCTVPTYSSNKIIVFENLTYYCQYTMTVYITDGTNCVSYSLTAETIYPYARIYYNGAWCKAFVYVYNSGWNLSVGNVYDGSWRIFNGVST